MIGLSSDIMCPLSLDYELPLDVFGEEDFRDLQKDLRGFALVVYVKSLTLTSTTASFAGKYHISLLNPIIGPLWRQNGPN